MRLDYTAESRGVKRPVKEVIDGQLGYIEGVDANGDSQVLKNMSSDPLGLDPQAPAPTEPAPDPAWTLWPILAWSPMGVRCVSTAPRIVLLVVNNRSRR